MRRHSLEMRGKNCCRSMYRMKIDCSSCLACCTAHAEACATSLHPYPVCIQNLKVAFGLTPPVGRHSLIVYMYFGHGVLTAPGSRGL